MEQPNHFSTARGSVRIRRRPLRLTLVSITAVVALVLGLQVAPSMAAATGTGLLTPLSLTTPPLSVTAVAGDGSAVVSWTPPLLVVGGPITSYTVTSTPGSVTATTADGDSLSITVPDLKNGTPHTFTVHATNDLGDSLESLPSNSVTPVASTFTAVSPARVWDSRSGPGPIGRIGPDADVNAVDVTVVGVGGVPATGVSAVVLNVTAVDPTKGTFVTVWPTREDRPISSNINIGPNDVRPNLVTVKVGAGGQVSFYNEAGTINLVADVAGWYGPSAAQRYTGVSPARVWDSRTGPGPIGRIGTASSVDVTVAGVSGVPATGVTAVVLNVTAVDPSAGTFVTAWPTGEALPVASNLNVPANDVRANLVIVKVGASGKVSFFNKAGSVHLVADVAGYFSGTGSSFTSVSPDRVWDSRVGPGPIGRIGTGGRVDVTVTGVGGVPDTGVTAVILNVTGVDPTAGTFITAYPTSEALPVASNLNLPRNDVRPNLVIAKVGSNGQVSFYNAAGTIDIVADVAGWYGEPGA